MSKSNIRIPNQLITELSAGVWEKISGSRWAEKVHEVLDFSSGAFSLETLSGPDGGLWNPLLNLKHLRELNLSKNQLVDDVDSTFVPDAPFAGSLQVLTLSKNLFVAPVIDLPALVVLDLSYNHLESLPSLDFLPNLEVLRLSHNRIEGLWESISKCAKLKELDISYNSIDISPSQITFGIHYLKRCPNLGSVYLAGNPFSNWFPEYQYFVAAALPLLIKLDDWDLTDARRAEILKHPLRSLEDYDQVYAQRQSAIGVGGFSAYRKQKLDAEDVVLDEIPNLEFFNTLLQHATQIPDSAVDYCSRVLSAAELVSSEPEEFGKLFGAPGLTPQFNGKPGRAHIPTSVEGKETVSQFLQNVTLLFEKHENVKPLLLRSLARLSCVPNENLGPLCLTTLSDLMLGGDQAMDEIAAIIENSIVPMIQGHPLTDIKCATLIKGFSMMRPSLALARSLAGAVIDIAAFLDNEPDDPALVAVIAMAVDFPPNATECSGQAVPQLVFDVIKRMFVDGQTEFSDPIMLVNLLHIAGRCSEGVKKTAAYFVREELHTKFVFQRLKEHFRTPDTSRWSITDARVVAAMIDFLSGVIQSNEQGMADCVDSFYLTDLLLIPMKEYLANPLILAAALRAIVVIFNDVSRRATLLEYITEQINRGVPLLQYIGGRTYKDLWDLGERCIIGRDTLAYRPSTPELPFCYNTHIHAVFCGLSHLLGFYLDNPEIPYCKVINEHLLTKNREKLLFRLLLVPSIPVKSAAISCLSKVPIENFDAEDVAVILSLLKTFQSFQSEDAAGLVVALLILLRKFVDDTAGASGQILRREHPKQTFDSVYELLSRAVAVPSKNLESEKSKMKICLASVEFLRAASRHMEFRNFLRSKEMGQMFRSIMIAEEESCLPESPDVVVERCWTGRDLSLLLRCLTGQARLSPRKKVAFRIINQISDVLEGRATSVDFGSDVTLQNLCRREDGPFSESQTRKQLRLLDESEWSDRVLQQTEFVRAKGPEKLLSYLTRLASKDFDIRLAVERKKKRHSEYWAGRLKGTKETMEDDLNSGKPVDGNLNDPVRLQFYPKPDSYEDETRWTMMQALHRCGTSINPDTSALYLRCGTGFYGSRTIWDNVVLGEMRPSFIVAASLRCFYTCMMVPISDEVFRHTISCIRQPRTLRKLVSLLETVQLFDCHVGAKFLAVVRLAITLEPHQPAESMDLIISYDVVSQTLIRIFRPFLHILKQSRSQPLGLAEQIFSTEVARLLAVVAKQTSYIKFSNQLIVQRWCVKKGLLRFLDVVSVRTLVAMVIYDLQVAAGSSRGTYISHLVRGSADQREEMRESCSAVLSELIQCCEPLKYTVIEAFNIAEVFQHAAVRRTFLFELFESANTGHYRQAVQFYLSVKHQRAERVLQLPVLHHWVGALRQTDPVQKIVALTNYNFYILSKPEGIRNFQATASQTSAMNAAIPSIEVTREFHRMTRIVRGYPSEQVVIVGWMTPGTDKEFYDVFIFDKFLSSIPLLQCLYALSGPDVDSRVNVYRDVVTKSCLKEYVSIDKIVIVTFVKRKAPQKTYIALHVLTEEHLFEFVVDWRYWFSPSPAILRPSNWQTLGDESSDEDIDVERKTRKGLDNFLGYTEALGEPGWDKDLVTEGRVAALGAKVLEQLPEWTRKDSEEGLKDAYRQKLDVAKHKLLSLVKKWRLIRLYEVKFGADDEPLVTYKFAVRREEKPEQENEEEQTEEIEKEKVVIEYEEVCVSYFDDSCRERWRHGIACGLNLLELSGHWKRKWRPVVDI